MLIATLLSSAILLLPTIQEAAGAIEPSTPLVQERDARTQAPPAPARVRRSGLRARPSYRPNDPGRPTVCLIHGIYSTSGSFVHLVPILERAGYGVVLYDFSYEVDLAKTAPAFVNHWRAFRERTGDRQPWAVLSHSMGAMLARYYVEGDAYADDVASLILIGPPNHGSALAPAQDVLRVIERIRASADPDGQTLVVLGNRIGAAAKDLTPGSAFLTRLSRNGLREGVPYYILAGNVGFLTREGRATIEAQLRLVQRRSKLLGGLANLAFRNLPAVLDVLTDGTGDGAVTVASTRLDGAAEHVVIPSNHVELIRGPLFFPNPGPVDCEPHVLRWLAESLPMTPRTAETP